MKINDLLENQSLFEALPGMKKSGFFSSIVNKLNKDPVIKKNVQQGVNAWLSYVNSALPADATVEQYVEEFERFVSRMAQIPTNNAKVNEIGRKLKQELEASTNRFSSKKAVKNAIEAVVVQKMRHGFGRAPNEDMMDKVLDKLARYLSLNAKTDTDANRKLAINIASKLQDYAKRRPDASEKELYAAGLKIAQKIIDPTSVKRKQSTQNPAPPATPAPSATPSQGNSTP